jgi:hypothetical protein
MNRRKGWEAAAVTIQDITATHGRLERVKAAGRSPVRSGKSSAGGGATPPVDCWRTAATRFAATVRARFNFRRRASFSTGWSRPRCSCTDNHLSADQISGGVLAANPSIHARRWAFTNRRALDAPRRPAQPWCSPRFSIVAREGSGTVGVAARCLVGGTGAGRWRGLGPFSLELVGGGGQALGQSCARCSASSQLKHQRTPRF